MKGQSPARLTHRRQPQQARSRVTVEVILTAARQVLLNAGLDGFNTNVVAQRAGVSIGSLYQFFPGKEAILATLVREMRRDMLTSLMAAEQSARGADLQAAISALIDASLEHHRAAPDLAEVIEEAEEHLPLDAETEALKAQMLRIVQDLFRDHGVEEPQTVARDVIAMCHGMVDAATTAGERDFNRISARLKRAVSNYVLGP